jgi:hypothetical protein
LRRTIENLRDRAAVVIWPRTEIALRKACASHLSFHRDAFDPLALRMLLFASWHSIEGAFDGRYLVCEMPIP